MLLPGDAKGMALWKKEIEVRGTSALPFQQVPIIQRGFH